MTKLFGTDGVRGVANRDLTARQAFELGQAGAHVLAKGHRGKCLVVGRDTRISGDMLEAALAAGICSAGVDVLSVGYLPTPAVAILTREMGAVGGVVISASHNPMEDNGIKFFGPSGYKLPDQVEDQIESFILDNQADQIDFPVGADLGRIRRMSDAEDRYLNFLKSTVTGDLKGLKVVLDCANGAAYRVAPRILQELGVEVLPIFVNPDGVNINAGCGSTHPATLQQQVVEAGADLGLAHDGDADRLIAVDHLGQLVDGDQMMVILARYLKERHLLSQNTVVTTVMSNLGLYLAMQAAGIKVLQTQVGDRYVVEELLKTGTTFGGEQSGHILFLEHSPTGDGILTALQLLTAVKTTGRTLADLANQMERLPQVLKNVAVEDKEKVLANPELAAAIADREKKLAGQGRILVRPSGTESLVRIMAEGRQMAEIEAIVDELVAMVQRL